MKILLGYGEGDRAQLVEGLVLHSGCCASPSTILRMVPLPRWGRIWLRNPSRTIQFAAQKIGTLRKVCATTRNWLLGSKS